MTIIDHNSERVLLVADLSEPNAGRLAGLARSFRARWVPALEGWALLPATATKVETLYEAGYCAGWRHGDWRYGPYGGKLTLRRYQAVRMAKEAVCPAQ